jgi:hypothetical protein
LASDTTVNVAPAASNLSVTALAVAGVGLTKVGPGSLTLNNVRSAVLAVNDGTVVIAPNGTSSGTSILGDLAIAGGETPTAKLDITDNAVILDYDGTSPVGSVRRQIIAGRGRAGLGATWNGQGISSSAAAAAQPESRSVAYADNSALPLGSFASFHGQPVDETSVLIAYTRTGDANLDGLVNDDDVTIVNANYAPGVSQPHWVSGDFDYSGFVDDDDITLLNSFFDASASAVPSNVAIPEPNTFLLCFCAIATYLCLLRARRRPAFSRASRFTFTRCS